MVAVVPQVLEAERGDGARTGAGVDEGAEDRAVAEPGGGRSVDRAEELASLGDSDFRSLAFPSFRAGWPDGLEGVDEDGVARDEKIEEVAQRGEREFLCGDGSAVAVQKPGGVARGGVGEGDVLGGEPLEETPDGNRVGLAGVRVADAGGEEFLRGEGRGGPGGFENRARRANEGVRSAGGVMLVMREASAPRPAGGRGGGLLLAGRLVR